MIEAVLGKVLPWLAAAVAFLGTLAAVWGKGRRDGRRDAEVAADRAADARRAEVARVTGEVNSKHLSRAELDALLRPPPGHDR